MDRRRLAEGEADQARGVGQENEEDESFARRLYPGPDSRHRGYTLKSMKPDFVNGLLGRIGHVAHHRDVAPEQLSTSDRGATSIHRLSTLGRLHTCREQS